MNRPLRFCVITTFYPPYNFGGDGINVHRLSNALAERGHHVEVIHSIDAYRLRGKEPAASYTNHPNVIMHGLETPFSLVASLASQQMGMPLFHRKRIKEILNQGFDVIHYHNVSLVGGPQVLTYGQGVKLYSIHEYWLVCPTHVLFRYNRAACTKPHCFLCNLTYARPPQWWRYTNLLRDASKHVDAFIAASQFCIDVHRRMKFDVPFAELPNFLPPAELAASGDESQGKEPYFLFVGRLEKLKGVHTLVPIFRKNPEMRLLIAGTGSQANELRELVVGSPNIDFLGHLTEQQLQGLYRRAVAVIMPSLCYEAFPQVLLESFRQQTPVIGRKLGAMPEIIEASGGGMVYGKDDELSAAMNQLMADSNLRRELGMKGYEAYRQKWTADAYLERYFELIHKIQESK